MGGEGERTGRPDGGAELREERVWERAITERVELPRGSRCKRKGSRSRRSEMETEGDKERGTTRGRRRREERGRGLQVGGGRREGGGR
jgi:hypothetical protein